MDSPAHRTGGQEGLSMPNGSLSLTQGRPPAYSPDNARRITRENVMETALAIIGSGFLRNFILEQLSLTRPGTVVRVLSRTPPEPVPGLRVEHVAGGTGDPAALYRAVTGARDLIHLGSEEGHAVPYSANVSGTAAVTSAAISQGCRHVLFYSSPDVYGDGPGRAFDEDEALAPQSRFARAKVIGERLTEQFGRLPGRASTVVRPFGLYGPGQPAESTLGRVVRAAFGGHPIPLPGGGQQLRNFTYVADVARGIVAAVGRANLDERPYAVYNLASFETISLRDAARLAIRLAGTSATITTNGRRGHGRPLAVQIPSVSRARAELGFHATTLLAEGLTRCLLHEQETAAQRRMVNA
ncbi:NAD-dependent epimerase/dehydratase family protein [Nonomuraea sp. NPDC050328]|uniref:NAD-dependent epimerase/dehydratase family protein n=1 Tax=Nonomuraea sp. NPDC050328 TaxID=3364361 RepID=UPI0037AE19F4